MSRTFLAPVDVLQLEKLTEITLTAVDTHIRIMHLKAQRTKLCWMWELESLTDLTQVIPWQISYCWNTRHYIIYLQGFFFFQAKLLCSQLKKYHFFLTDSTKWRGGSSSLQGSTHLNCSASSNTRFYLEFSRKYRVLLQAYLFRFKDEKPIFFKIMLCKIMESQNRIKEHPE